MRQRSAIEIDCRAGRARVVVIHVIPAARPANTLYEKRMFRRISFSFSKLAVIGALGAVPLVTSSAASAQEQVPPTTVPPTTAPPTTIIPPSAPVTPPPLPPGPPGPPTTLPAQPPPPAPPGDISARPPGGHARGHGHRGGHMHDQRVPTTIDSGPEKHAVLERKVSTEETYGRFAFVVPVVGQTAKWEQVCVAPCSVELDRHSSYRVARANNIPSTREFTLPPESQNLHLQVEPGNLLMHRIASRLIGAGTAAAIVGGALITTASEFKHEDDVRVAGIITGAAGIVLLAVGIPLAIVNQTHVKTNDKPLASTTPTKTAKPGPKLTFGGVIF